MKNLIYKVVWFFYGPIYLRMMRGINPLTDLFWLGLVFAIGYYFGHKSH